MSKRYQVIVAWNREASWYAEEHTLKTALRKSRQKNSDFTMGVYTFNTEEEANAFRMGIEEGNGWDRPHYETFQV
jgi:hypothetical protein